MRELWARVGVTFRVSEAEYRELLKASKDEDGRYSDVDFFIDDASFRNYHCEFDGDCYIPASEFENQERWGENYDD